MAMSESNLSDAIITELEAAGFEQTEHAQFKALADAIATAVVAEVKKATINAECSMGGTVSGSGVLS